MYSQLLLATSTADTPSIWSIIWSSWTIWLPILISALSFFLAILSYQNSRQVSFMTRHPYIKLRLHVTVTDRTRYQLILENIGGRIGIIDKVEIPIEWKTFAYDATFRPFEFIEKTELAPGEKIYTDLSPKKTNSFLYNYHQLRQDKGFSRIATITYHSEPTRWRKAKPFTTESTLNFSAFVGSTYVIPQKEPFTGE